MGSSPPRKPTPLRIPKFLPLKAPSLRFLNRKGASACRALAPFLPLVNLQKRLSHDANLPVYAGSILVLNAGGIDYFAGNRQLCLALIAVRNAPWARATLTGTSGQGQAAVPTRPYDLTDN